MKAVKALKNMKTEYKIELIFLFAIMVYYTMWARIQPLGVSPDEKMRYDIALFIYRHGSLPHGADPEIMNMTWGTSYGFNPILSYMISALFMKVMSIVNSHDYALLMAARLTSILCGTGAIFFAIRIAKYLFKDKKVWMLIFIAAFFPNMAFISSYVNTDALAMFSTAFIFYVWLRAIREGWTWKNCGMLGVSIAICTLSYYNAYGFILCSIFLFGLTILLGDKPWDFRELFTKGLFISAIVLALAGWWFVRNYILYDGDFLARRTVTEIAEIYAKEGFKPSTHTTPKDWGYSPIGMMFSDYPLGDTWIHIVIQSFIGTFGAISILQPRNVYRLWWLLLGLGLFGNIFSLKKLFAIRENGKWRKEGWFGWCTLIAAIIPNVLNVYYSYATDYQPQGRYSLPMFFPLLYFVVNGYSSLVGKIVKDNELAQKIFNGIGIFAMALGISCYLYVFRPSY